MKHIFILISFLLLAFSCQNNASSEESAQETTKEVAEEAEPLQAAAPVMEKPTVRYLETAIGKVPVYGSFDGVEPYFQKKNDTTYIINFWATWCKPCVEELPYFEQMQQTYQDQKVQVVLVSMDFERQLEKKLKPFLEEHRLESQVVVLADSKYNNWIDRVDTSWGGAIPVTMIYNAEEKKFYGEQFADFKELETALKEFL